MKVRVHDQAGAEDGVISDHDRAGGHQPGAVDFDPVTDLDSGLRAKSEQSGPPRRIADGNIAPDDDPASAADSQPQWSAEPWSKSMARIAKAQIQAAEAHADRGSAREGI